MSKERKTETIIVRVTKTTKDSLLKGANSLGIKMSEFVRRILDNEKD